MTRVVGKITVPTAGTPIQLSAQAAFTAALTRAGLATTFVKVHAVHFQALPGNSGKVYLGESGLVKATYVLVGFTFPAPTSGFFPTFGITEETSPAGVDCSVIWLDVDTSGEGLSVMVEIT